MKDVLEHLDLKISIVIPTLGRDSYVIDCLNDLCKSTVKPCEVIIIDQGNQRPNPGIFNCGLPVRHFRCTSPNASLARNIGLLKARGRIVLFLDDDVRIRNPDFVLNHIRHYEHSDTCGVYGQVLEVGQLPTDHPAPPIIETDWGWMKLPANYSRPCKTRNGGSGNLSVRRDWALNVGGMDAWFEKGARREETEFNLRYTKSYGLLTFDPEAGLIHLSAAGGSRSWGAINRSVPMHHVVGHWYFLLRAAKDRTLSLRGLIHEMRYILVALLKNPQAGYSPFLALNNAARALWGLGLALSRLFRGPRRIDLVRSEHYYQVVAEQAVE